MWFFSILWLLNPINFYAHRFQTSCGLSQSCVCWTLLIFMPIDFRPRVSLLNPMYVEPHPMPFDFRRQVSCLNPMIAEPHSMPIDLGRNAAVLSGWLYMVCFSNYIQLYQVDVYNYMTCFSNHIQLYQVDDYMTCFSNYTQLHQEVDYVWHTSYTKWMTISGMFQ